MIVILCYHTHLINSFAFIYKLHRSMGDFQNFMSEPNDGITLTWKYILKNMWKPFFVRLCWKRTLSDCTHQDQDVVPKCLNLGRIHIATTSKLTSSRNFSPLLKKVINYITDKSGRMCVDTPENYTECMQVHLQNTEKVATEEYRRIEKEINSHMHAWCNIIHTDERVRRSLQMEDNEVRWLVATTGCTSYQRSYNHT